MIVPQVCPTSDKAHSTIHAPIFTKTQIKVMDFTACHLVHLCTGLNE